MDKENKIFEFQLASDVKRRYRVAELLLDGTPLLDVGLTDEKVMEIAFNGAIAGRIFNWEEMKDLMDQAIKLALQDAYQTEENETEALSRGQESNS